MALKGCFYVGVSLCFLHMSNVFVARAVFTMDNYHIFSSCVLAVIPLKEGVIGVVVARTALVVEEGLLFALWLSQPCQGLGLLPTYWSRLE